MKHFLNKTIMIAALVLALILGVVALAETVEPQTPELPAVEDTQPQPDTEVPADTSTTDSTALQDALNAYNAARQSSRVEDLETELNGYVASGKLTQEQADLILNYYKEQESLRNGVCPNCGYAFQNNGGFGRGGKGGRMNGGFGKGGRGGMGGMRGFGQLPSTNQNDGTANGTAYESEWNTLPSLSGLEGI